MQSKFQQRPSLHPFPMRILLFSLSASALVCVAAGAGRPNIVWIVSEDNSMHYLKHFFPGGAETPAIEALAAHGLTFDHAFSNAPVCSVARTTLATKCYGPRIGTQFHRRYQLAPMPEGVRMFPEYLRKAGYYTTNNSKTDYNAVGGEAVWDESSGKAGWQYRADAKQPFSTCNLMRNPMRARCISTLRPIRTVNPHMIQRRCSPVTIFLTHLCFATPTRVTSTISRPLIRSWRTRWRVWPRKVYWKTPSFLLRRSRRSVTAWQRLPL
jgi:hypothetical protein